MFKNVDGVYENLNMCNVNNSSMGNSEEWNAMYSKVQTKFMGFIEPRVTLSGVGMGACERGWGVIKRIKYCQRAKLTGTKTEKLSIISTTHRLNKLVIKSEALEGLQYKYKNVL